MTESLLDEDGRCRRTELLPSACGCAAHRGGEVVDLDKGPRDSGVGVDGVLESLDDLVLVGLILAKYDGHCSANRRHSIRPGDEIGKAVHEDDHNDVIGWVCEQCTRTLLA